MGPSCFDQQTFNQTPIEEAKYIILTALKVSKVRLHITRVAIITSVAKEVGNTGADVISTKYLTYLNV